MSASTPTQHGPNIFEEIFRGYADRLEQQQVSLLQKQDQYLANLDKMIGALVALGAGGAQAAAQPGEQQTALQGILHGLTPDLPLPLSPTLLAHSVIAADVSGISAFQFLSEAVTVAAGGSHTITIPVAAHNVMIIAAPFRFFSTVHSPDITTTMTVDTINVLLNNWPFTADSVLEMPQYGKVREQIVATITNNTSSPVTVTYEAQVVLISDTDYDDVWTPLFKVSYRILEAYASAVVQAGVVQVGQGQ